MDLKNGLHWLFFNSKYEIRVSHELCEETLDVASRKIRPDRIDEVLGTVDRMQREALELCRDSQRRVDAAALLVFGLTAVVIAQPRIGYLSWSLAILATVIAWVGLARLVDLSWTSLQSLKRYFSLEGDANGELLPKYKERVIQIQTLKMLEFNRATDLNRLRVLISIGIMILSLMAFRFGV